MRSHELLRRARAALACCALAGAVVAPAGAVAPSAPSSGGVGALDLSAYRGKVVYVDFWASWCGPCRQSFPWMERMQQQYGRDGFVVVAVNLDHERSDADRFLHEFTPNFQVAFDPDGRLAERYRVAGMPTSLLIDRSGAVRLTHAGFRTKDPDLLEQQIRTLLAARP